MKGIRERLVLMSATLGLNAFKSLSLEQGGEQRAAGENDQNKSGVE